MQYLLTEEEYKNLTSTKMYMSANNISAATLKDKDAVVIRLITDDKVTGLLILDKENVVKINTVWDSLYKKQQ